MRCALRAHHNAGCAPRRVRRPPTFSTRATRHLVCAALAARHLASACRRSAPATRLQLPSRAAGYNASTMWFLFVPGGSAARPALPPYLPCSRDPGVWSRVRRQPYVLVYGLSRVWSRSSLRVRRPWTQITMGNGKGLAVLRIAINGGPMFAFSAADRNSNDVPRTRGRRSCMLHANGAFQASSSGAPRHSVAEWCTAPLCPVCDCLTWQL